jgi:putative membrane-bound dehydrogenase-like protein
MRHPQHAHGTRARTTFGTLLLLSVALQAGAADTTESSDLRAPANALLDLEVYEGLEVTLFASEPMIGSPTNLDIDDRGRVWICEVVNYHRNRGRRREGDRILILEDSGGDGRADSVKVFYQGTDVDSAMGICVLGNRVIVTSSPNVLVFTDTDGDDRPDRKEILFTQTGHPEHDHSAHSFVFGPDGKLYWNFGNAGQAVHDRLGKPVVDTSGNVVADGGRPYHGGMVFRCDIDGGNFEVLGHNFRNNYEATVDSFGTVWQTDNDDDGNHGARMSYVMEHGNFGYRDELTGAAWWRHRTGQHEDVGHRHFHQNDPGVVPNCIVTGNGAPGGITVYEGRLLPEIFWDLPFHGDTVTNVVHANRIRPDGAGYSGETISLLRSRKDRWFRPVDVCTAPDGSVFVTDWYDPGVGGHRQADTQRGRVYRIAPAGTPYRTPRFDFSTATGASAALRNPSFAVRYLAWTALHAAGREAEPALLELFGLENPRLRARALWLLGRIEGRGARYVKRALEDPDENIRVAGVRLAKQLGIDRLGIVSQLARDPSPAVRRECAIALRGQISLRASELWAALALQHRGDDRWYLEALGIGADGDWNERFLALLRALGTPSTQSLRAPVPPGVRDIIWRSRSRHALPLLAQLIRDPSTAEPERLRYFRAFDFHSDATKNAVLLGLAGLDHAQSDAISVLAMKHHGGGDLAKAPALQRAVRKALDASRGTPDALAIIRRFGLRQESSTVARMALDHVDDRLSSEALDLLKEWNAFEELIALTDDPDPGVVRQVITLLGRAPTEVTVRALSSIVANVDRSTAARNLAIKMHRRNATAEKSLLALLRDGKIPPQLQLAAANVLLDSRNPSITEETSRYVILPKTTDHKPVPTLRQLRTLRGNADRGRLVFQKEGKCASCHVVGGEGKIVGPELSGIGAKLGREALYEAILFPSVAISHGYEAYVAVTRDGTVIPGVLRERTDATATLITAEGVTRTLKTTELQELVKQPVSLMPQDLYKSVTLENLVDLVEFLTTLKEVAPASKR